jgi:hypothetical protein
MANAQGMARDLLLYGENIVQNNYPGRKVTPPGFYLMARDLTAVEYLNNGFGTFDNGTGHVTDVKYRYVPRGIQSDSRTVKSCDPQASPTFIEATMPSPLYREVSVHYDWDYVRKFEKEASALRNGGNVSVGVMEFVWNMLQTKVNSLVTGIERDLLAAQAVAFGTNAVSGVNTARTVNFPLNTTNNPLNQGIPMLWDDLIQNEAQLSEVSMVGSGLFHNFIMQQKAKGIDQSGVNTPAYELPKFYYSQYAATDWGANHVGAFEKGGMGLIDINKYVGSFSGQMANSYFGVFPMPVVDPVNKTVMTILFDIQVREFDCATTITTAYGSYTIGPGVQVILSKNYGLFNMPSNMYVSGDRLSGVNGSWRYVATNV